MPAPAQLATQLWNDEGLSNALAALDTFSSIAGQPSAAPAPAPAPAPTDSSRLGVRLESAMPVSAPAASLPMHGSVYAGMPGMPAAGPNIMSMLQGAHVASATTATTPSAAPSAGSAPDGASLMSLLSAGAPVPAAGSMPGMHAMPPHGMSHSLPRGVPHGMPPAGTYGWMPQTAGYMPPRSAPGMPRPPVDMQALHALASRLPPQQVHLAYAQAAMAAAHQQQQQQQQLMQMEQARRLAGQPAAVVAASGVPHGMMPHGVPAQVIMKPSSDVPPAAVGAQVATQAAAPASSAVVRQPPLPAGVMPPLPTNPPPPLPLMQQQQSSAGVMPAGAPPASVAHLFSISLNTGHRRYMSRGEIMFIASRMYKNISVAESMSTLRASRSRASLCTCSHSVLLSPSSL